jgi:hypothetical protein
LQGADGHPAAGSEYGRLATKTSAIAHDAHLLVVPNEIRPHVGTVLAASLADKAIFNIGQPQVIGPLIGADRDAVTATIVPSTFK